MQKKFSKKSGDVYYIMNRQELPWLFSSKKKKLYNFMWAMSKGRLLQL